MKKWLFLFLLFVGHITISWSQTISTITQTTAGNYTFTIPSGVTSITVECYGAGGGGGGTGANYTIAGGGAGGSYVKYTYAVTPGTTFNYTVGAGGSIGSTAGSDGGTGNNSFFGNSSAGSSIGALVLAVGGAGGKGNSAAGTGSSNFSGGALGGVGTNSGNLPVSGATTNAAGNSGTTSIGGVNTSATSGSGGISIGPNAGAAGAGQTNSSSNGNPGFAPGGGGAGGYRSTGTKIGGLGGDGGVYITYTFPQNINIFNTSGTWICPAGVSQVFVECWGGGGAGGSAYSASGTAASAGGGGAGGTYVNGLLNVTSSINYTVTVGAASIASTIPSSGSNSVYNSYNNQFVNGNPSWFNTTTTLYADGGGGGQTKTVTSGSIVGLGTKGSGTITNSVGTVKKIGGNGFTPTTASGSSDKGGGGGSSGGSLAIGNNATSTSGASAVSSSDGAGGNGGNQNGGDGVSPGGGGGGARAATSSIPRAGGQGAAGQVIVYSYAVPTIGSLSSTSANLNSTGVTLTVTGTNFYPNNISQITWGGTAITTTYISSTSISAVIDTKLTAAGTFAIGVINTGPYGLSTVLSTLNFTVVSGTSATDYFRSAVAGSWSTASNWQSSNDNSNWITSTLVPDVNAKGITIRSGFDISTSTTITADDITIDSGATLTIGSGFTVNDGTANTDILVNGTLIANGNTLTNNGIISVIGTFQINQGGFATGGTWNYGASGTLIFNHTSGTYGAINASHSYWPSVNGPFNLTINNASSGGIDLGVSRTVSGTFATSAGVVLSSSSVLTLTGTCQINSGGFFTNTPTYGSASTLVYNTTYGVSNEWTGNSTTAGLGVPQNVTIQNNATVTMPNSNKGMAGNLSLASGSLVLNATSGDLYLAGNWSRASTATFTPSGRAIFFNGSITQNVTVSGGGTETFNYLLVQGSGTLQLATGTNLTVNSSGGLSLSSSNTTSTIDLNGQTLTLSGGGNLNLNNGARKITTSLTGGKFIITNSSINFTNLGSLTIDATNNTTFVLQNQLNCGSNSSLVINGTLQIDPNGFLNLYSPIYGSSSTLLYNTGGTYGRGYEWFALGVGTIGTTAGYPNNIQISNNTSINYINGAASGVVGIKALAGNLTIDFGSKLYMDYNLVSSGGALNVAGNVTNNGIISLGFAVGDDLKLGGNLNNTGTFNGNNRAVFFTKNGTQTISSTSALTIPYIVFAPVSGATTVQLLNDLTVSAILAGNAISFNSSSDVFDLNGNTLTIGTANVGNVIAGSGSFKGSATSNLTLLGNGSAGILNFTTGAQNIGTFTINRSSGAIGTSLGTDLLITTALTLTSGLLDLSTKNLTLAANATIGGTPSINNFIIAVNGEFRKTLTANGSFTFPIGDSATYTPATLNFTAGTYNNAYIGVKVTNAKHPSNVATTDFLKRYWSVTSSGITSPTYSFSGTYTSADIVGTESNAKPGRYNGTSWTDISSTSISSNTLTLNGLTTLSATNDFSAGSPLNAGSSVTDYFRSAVSGSWSTASNWQSSSNNSTWNTATIAPDYRSSGITIRIGFDITSSSSISADDITIDSGATLTLSGGTFTLNNGAVTVDMQVNGTFTRSGGTFTQGASGMAFGTNATYNHAIVASTLTLPIATWNATSTCNVTGINNSIEISGGNTIGQTFGNFIWNNSAATAFMNVENNAFTVAGTLTIGSSGGSLFSLANPATATTYSNTINSIVVNGGQFDAVGYQATVNLTVTNGISLSSGYFVVSNGSGNATVNAGSCNITGGVFYIASDVGKGTFNVGSCNLTNGIFYVASSSGQGTFSTSNDLTVSSISSSNYGTLIVSKNSGVGTVNVGKDLILNGDGLIKLIRNASSPSTTINITRDLLISGTDSAIYLEEISSTSGVATINVGRDFSCTAATNYANIDFGDGTVSGNAINISGNFTKSGTGEFYTLSSTSAPIGFVFNGSGTTQTFSYSGTNSDCTSYTVKSSAKLQMITNLTLSTYSIPISSFTVAGGGFLDFQTNSIIGNSISEFITSSGTTLITANTNGMGGTSTSGSLQNFGALSSSTTASAGRINLPAGVNYTFNGGTVTPFPIPTLNFGSPATVIINSTVTSNMTSNLTVTTGFVVNNGGTFKLNTTNNNNLYLNNNAALTINAGGTFDNGGENQITNSVGTPTITITGTFITRDVQGFVGSTTSIPSITPALNPGSTVEYGLSGDQAVQGQTAPTYQNVTFSGSGTKTLASTNAVVGTITVSGSSVFDASNFTFGGTGTNVTMTGTSRFKMAGTSTKPDASGTYSLASGTTIEFANTVATQQDIRLAPTYANIDISGTNVGLSGDSSSLKLQANATFTVKNGGTFNVRNTNGFNGAANTAINNTNSPTVTLETGSTINYNCPTANSNQNITPFTNTITPTPTYTDSNKSYYNMTVSGLGTKSISSSSEILIGNNLNVTAGTLQIDSNKLLTVTNLVTNSSGNAILIKNSGSLVQINDNVPDVGTIKMTRTSRSMALNDYVYWGSPVQENVLSQIPTILNANYMWDTNGTVDGAWNTISNTIPGKGFITRFGSAGTVNFDFTGVPNNGIVNVPHALSYTHGIGNFDSVATGNTILLANPYPSAINAASFITANNNSTGNIGGTLYFWTSFTQPDASGYYTTNDYASWNATGATGTTALSGGNVPTGKIAAGQGFFAQIYDDADIVFKNAMRVRSTTDNSQFFRNSNTTEEQHRIWLSIKNNNHAYRQTLVGYVSGATNDRDLLYDGDAFTDNEVNLYSVLNTKPMVIQGRALPFNSSDLVPLGYKVTTAGDYTLKIDELDGLFVTGQTIYVEDLLLSTVHELSQTPYSFTTAAGVFDNRFVLRYTDTTLSIPTFDSSNTVHFFTKNHQFFIKSELSQLKEITVYDVLGRLLFENKNIKSREYESPPMPDQQTLIVKIKLENGQVISKKIVTPSN